MHDKKDASDNATDIIFQSVYALSLSMLQLVRKMVNSASSMDRQFIDTAKQLQDVNDNFNSYIISKDWISKPSLEACQKKMEQTHELVDICLSYSSSIRSLSDRVIKITKGMEQNKKMRDISDHLVDKLREEISEEDSEDGDD